MEKLEGGNFDPNLLDIIKEGRKKFNAIKERQKERLLIPSIFKYLILTLTSKKAKAESPDLTKFDKN